MALAFFFATKTGRLVCGFGVQANGGNNNLLLDSMLLGNADTVAMKAKDLERTHGII